MAKILLVVRWADACCQKMFSGWKISRRVLELLTESRIQSSELQEEMRSDVEALTVRLQEANEQVCELKTRMIGVKEAAVANKARSDRQVAQLASEKDETVVAMKELRNRVAELNEALVLSHAEEEAEPHQLGQRKTGPQLHHRSVRAAGCVQGDGVGRNQG